MHVWNLMADVCYHVWQLNHAGQTTIADKDRTAFLL